MDFKEKITYEEAKEYERKINEKIDAFEENEKKSRNLDEEHWIMIVKGVNSDYPTLKEASMTLAIMGVERYALSLLKSKGIKIYDEDFTQSVKLGILSALPNYDPTRATATTYFKPYILSEIMDEYRMLSSGPKESRYRQMDKVKVNTAISELQKMGISDPSAEDVYAYLLKKTPDAKKAKSVQNIRKIMESLQPTASLDELIGITNDKETIDPEYAAMMSSLKEGVEKAKESLDSRSRFIIEAMLWWEENYGDGRKKMPFKELYTLYIKGCDPNATQEMVRRRQRVAIQSMRIALSRNGYSHNSKAANRMITDKKKLQEEDIDVFSAISVNSNFFDDFEENSKEIMFANN